MNDYCLVAAICHLTFLVLSSTRTSLGRQRLREPAVLGKVDHQLPHRPGRHLDALGPQGSRLILRPGRMRPAVWALSLTGNGEDEERGEVGAHLGDITPLALMMRCHGTLV